MPARGARLLNHEVHEDHEGNAKLLVFLVFFVVQNIGLAALTNS